MKYNSIITSAFLLAFGICLLSFIKEDEEVIQKAATQLIKWAADAPQEKVYLHLDKPYYAIGDDIWFKAYIVSGRKHQLSAISNILNVELINDRDSIQKSIKLNITSGVAWGYLKLTDSLTEGNYRIRAYTNWMRNAGSDYFFDKTIQVGNSLNNNVFTNVTYTYNTQNNQNKVNALIKYTDVKGSGYIGKPVRYEVVLNGKYVKDGKAVTDVDGNINLSFIDNNLTPFKNGYILSSIQLDNKLRSIRQSIPVKTTSDKIDTQFFPESGYLVNGIRSKVAFKAIGTNGHGIDVKGIIIDDQQNEVVQLTSQHLGMGFFSFTPETGKTYTAKLKYANGSEATMPLPAASDKGYVLNVYNNPESEDVTVKISLAQATYQENKNSEINLVAQTDGAIYYAAKTKLESAIFTTTIPRKRFRTGIVQFTLFSAKGEPMNERIAFIQNPDLLNLSLSSLKPTFGPREKTQLNIVAKNKNDEPVTGTFSVSVIDETKVPYDENDESTILSNILLTSDIKGYIEKPNYYFANVTDKTKADLDVLMLTQGYRRFEWQQVMSNIFPQAAFPPEKTLSIAGYIKNMDGKPMERGKVTLLTTSGGINYTDAVADDQGRFAFDNLTFGDSTQYIIQARSAKDRKSIVIDLTNVSSQAITRNKNTGDIQVNIGSTIMAYLQNSKKQYDNFVNNGIIKRNITLNEVSIASKKTPVFTSGSILGSGHSDKMVPGDKFLGCVQITECLPYLFNLVLRNNTMYLSGNMTMGGGVPVRFMLDGFFIDGNALSLLRSTDLESVELLSSASNLSIYGSQAMGGIIMFNTKRGGATNYKHEMPGVIVYNPVGIQKTREFYSPRYDDPKTNAKIADLRTTIYWQPNVITDKAGNASLSFFNADSPGTYRAVIEGIDADGNIGRQVYRYKVQ